MEIVLVFEVGFLLEIDVFVLGDEVEDLVLDFFVMSEYDIFFVDSEFCFWCLLLE